MSEPMSEAERLVSLLSDVYNEKGVWIWLTSANRNLNGYAPTALLINGGGEQVMREAHRISDRDRPAPPSKIHRNWPCPVCGLSPDEVCSCEQLGLKPAPQPPPSVPAGAEVAEVLRELLDKIEEMQHADWAINCDGPLFKRARAALKAATGARAATGEIPDREELARRYQRHWRYGVLTQQCYDAADTALELIAAPSSSKLLPAAPSSAATSGAPPARVWWSDELGWIWGFDGRYEADDWSSRWQIAELPSDAVELAAAPPTPSAPGVAELLAECARRVENWNDPGAYISCDEIVRLLTPGGVDGTEAGT